MEWIIEMLSLVKKMLVRLKEDIDDLKARNEKQKRINLMMLGKIEELELLTK